MVLIRVAAVGLLVVGLVLANLILMARMVRDLWRAVTAPRRRRRRLALARLTEREAVALAATAIGEQHYAGLLSAALEEEGPLIWRVDSMTFDMGVSATVDDATGAVSDVRHWSAWPRR